VAICRYEPVLCHESSYVKAVEALGMGHDERREAFDRAIESGND
jgi:hypothetical protein